MDVAYIGKKRLAGVFHGFTKPVGMENVPDYPGFSLYSFQQREEGAAGAEVIVGLKQQLNTVGSRNLYGFTITLYITFRTSLYV